MDRFECYDLAHAIRGAALGRMPDIPDGPCSGAEACELISQWMRSRGIVRTPKEIWEYSPGGELFMVFEWYRQALSWLQRTRGLPAPAR